MKNLENPEELLEQIERNLKKINDHNEKITKPFIEKFPTLFAFVFTFSFVAILYGFELIMSRINFIQENPYFLIIVGVIFLFATGNLYKYFNK